jgi:hypothetical protein
MRKQKDRRELEFQLATEILKLTTALIALLTALLHFLKGD